ncbi:MAG TPA: STAS domain-containing protein [Alloacidobacterium sp.]|nr:STAS domain-containing protein [Alloacidobacterium sp.]
MNTTIRVSAVIVKQLPEALSVKQRWIFLREIESCMRIDRPRIVLDCANVRRVDRALIHLLLRCLEEAMKCNGDVKLAAIPHEAKAVLELTGVNRLFEISDTTAEAVKSFHQIPAFMLSQTIAPKCSDQESESAA